MDTIVQIVLVLFAAAYGLVVYGLPLLKRGDSHLPADESLDLLVYDGGADDPPPPGAKEWAAAVSEALAGASADTFKNCVLKGMTRYQASQARVAEVEELVAPKSRSAKAVKNENA
jgi:hypothetical protein